MKQNFLADLQKHIPGIYGGMGPLAHIQFEKLLLEEGQKRGAKKDQDYPVWMVVSGSATPDRTKSLAGEKNSVAHMKYYTKVLQTMGADFIVMTCNTAHAYIPQIQPKIAIPIVSIIETTAQYITKNFPSVKNVGIMATTGTLQSSVYHTVLKQHGLTPISPTMTAPTQKQVMDAIYHPLWGVKSTGSHVDHKAIGNLLQATEWYQQNGAQIIIAGCTEISVALADPSTHLLPIVDPLRATAEKTYDLAFGLQSIKERYVQKITARTIKSHATEMVNVSLPEIFVEEAIN